ncbi:MAG TPA: NAD/NADP octopine/nopaline dehydrogenase family protein [Cellulomonas sp.]
MSTPTARPVTAVVGTGPGGCAAAALLSRAGHEVRVLGRASARGEAVAAAGALRLVEPESSCSVTGLTFTTDPASAVTGASRVVLLVPTSTIAAYASSIAPWLDPGTRVLLAPGHTGGALVFRTAVRAHDPALAAALPVAETCTLPFVARMTTPAEVTVWRRTENLLTGALPAASADELVAAFSGVFEHLRPVGSVLESSLSNLNAVLHPPGMLGNIGWIESTGGAFRYYSEGVTPGVAAIMDAIDAERLAIAAAFGLDLPPFIDMFHAAGLVDDAVHATGDTYQAVHTSGPNLLIQAPASLTDRYVAEDVGSGLVALTAFARAARVATPVMDGLIELACVVNRTDYRRVGTTATAMGLTGLDRDGVLALVTS